MSDYYIYKIFNLDYPEYVYIGSTKNFTRRKQFHKSTCYNENSNLYNIKLYKTIRENSGWNAWEMKAIEIVKCENKREAETHEQKWFEKIGGNLNSQYPKRNGKDYYKDNLKKKSDYSKKYREQNKMKLNDYNKKYYIENKEKIKEQKYIYRQQNIDKIKEKDRKYCLENKEKLKDKMKKWYEANKEKMKEKIECECGSIITKNNLLRHKSAKKHLNYIENKKSK